MADSHQYKRRTCGGGIYSGVQDKATLQSRGVLEDVQFKILKSSFNVLQKDSLILPHSHQHDLHVESYKI